MCLTNSEDNKLIAIIIGRFQTPKLHLGYEYLIKYIQNQEQFGFYGILIGTSKEPNLRNPLPFEPRKKMIDAFIHEQTNNLPLFICEIKDVESDDLWTMNLDTIISNYVEKAGLKLSNVRLIGSRDSFIKYYSGQFQTLEIEPYGLYNSTELRNSIKFQPDNENFILGFNSAKSGLEFNQTIGYNSKWMEGYIFYMMNKFNKN